MSRRRFLAWGTAAAAGLVPLLSACSQQAAPAPTAAPAAPAAKPGATTAPAAPAPTKAAAAPTTPPKAAVIELKFDHHEPAQANLGRTFQQYADTVNKAAEGALHVTVYPAETLSKAKDAYMNCVNGVNDFAWAAPNYTAGQFPLTEAFNLPLMGIVNGKHGARVFTKWVAGNAQLQKEWDQVVQMCPFANGAGFLYTTDRPITKLEDMNGLKVRCTGPGPTNLIKSLGANPIPTSVPESFEALSKGILNAGIFDWQAINSQHLYESLKYGMTDLTLIFAACFITFNKQKWASIPADLQKILQNPPGLEWQPWDTVLKGPAPSLGEFLANGFDVAEETAVDEFKKNGGQLVSYSDALKADWNEAVKPVYETWAGTVKDRGIDGMKEIAALQAIVKETAPKSGTTAASL